MEGVTQGTKRAGWGHTGYCRLCNIDDPKLQDDFNRRVHAKPPPDKQDKRMKYAYSVKSLCDWLEAQGLPRPASQTVNNHRKHTAHPKDRLMTSVQNSQLVGYRPRARVSDDEFLDTIVSIGHAKIEANPEEVTIDQALRAAQIRGNMKRQGQDLAQIVAIFTGAFQPPDDTIEGEVREA